MSTPIKVYDPVKKRWVAPQSSDHALWVTDEWPLYPISPVDASTGAAAHEHLLDAGTGNSVLSIYVIVGPEDKVTAGDIAKEGGPECAVLLPGSYITPKAEKAIQKVYIVGVSTATNAAGSVIAYNETDDATIRSALIELDFNATDDVRTIKVAASAAGQQVLVNIGGRSHA